MSRFGWSLPPGCRDSDIDRDSERLDHYDPDDESERRERQREVDDFYGPDDVADAPRPLEPLEAELDFGGYADCCYRCDSHYVRKVGAEVLCESCAEDDAEVE